MKYIERMEQELKELEEKRTKANKALTMLDLDKSEYAMLYAQVQTMNQYINLLNLRINYAKSK